MRLGVGHQHSQHWPILTRFVDYYSLFWGAGVISTSNEPWGRFTCRSSTLIVLADSDPFHGLLLTVLGSRSDPMINNPGVRLRRSSTLTVLENFGPFRGLLLIVLG